MRVLFFLWLIIGCGMVGGTIPSVLCGVVEAGNRVPNQGDKAAILAATKKGDAHAIRSLLRAGADVNERDEFGNTPLMIAADTSNLTIVKILLSAGADVRAANKSGFTALMNAADQGNPMIVKTLIEAGSDVKARSKAGFSPLYMALRHVCEKNRPCSTIKELVTMLIDKGADVNACTTPEGDSVLITAAALGNVQSVKVLVERGAVVNLSNGSGETAACVAQKEGYPDIVSFLKLAGGIGCSE